MGQGRIGRWIWLSGSGLTGIGRSGGTGNVPEILGLGFREKLELNDENSILKLNSVRINLANFGMLHLPGTQPLYNNCSGAAF